MNRLSYIAFFLLLTLVPMVGSAQSNDARQNTRKGNREYRAKKYDRAEDLYRRAIHYDSNAYRSQYNMGNALYRQKKYDEATQHYTHALQQPDLSKRSRSQILHNRGNSYLKAGLEKENRAEGMEQFKSAVNDYQEALKLNPKNDNTRYNLSYAKKMLQQAQQQNQQNKNNQGGGQNDKDQKNKDGNNGQNQDQNKQNQDQGNQKDQQQNKDQQQQNKQQQKQQQQQKKQDAERILEAVKNNEKKTMKDNAKKVEVAAPARIEKDW